ncbi:transcriptional regulator [Clostridium sp. MCC353]|uniref:LCP family protein n=1 Tax=Clostridium sp. MCC353 TaxID=2592646 RepID=UPI001C024BE2|nr:LCP family protein [Clostridium sp. MCC353]MBT9779488.1 transcriptional regulator [Clostridium sp. MCC353]
MRNKNRKKELYTAAAAILFLAFLCWFGRYSVQSYQGSKAAKEKLAARQTAGSGDLNRADLNRTDLNQADLNGDPVQEGRDNGNGEVIYQGKSYRRNTAMRAILCIGVDTKGEMESHTAAGQGGQADGVFLVAQDAARDRVKILMIPRDSMTEITLFDLSGNELGKDIQHLTLAYAYGDGREKSCELMKEAVSNLLGNLKIDGYAAVNISAIPVLNDAVGGVTVTVREEGLEKRDPSLKNGQTITLDGRQAEIFIRYRDVNKSQTAVSRMDRQKEYLQGYLQAAKAAAAQNDRLIPELMNRLQSNMITNMAKDQYLDMALSVLNSQESLGDGDILTIPGEAVETNLYDEYHVDREALVPMVLELFYVEKR